MIFLKLHKMNMLKKNMNSDTFIADLHIHSKYSRATARNLDLENIYVWAQRKGIRVVGTGDFTHPEWFSKITEKLEPAEPGLYRLKAEIAGDADQKIAPRCLAPVRFMLSCEISNIYKKGGKTRKNHNLVFFPEIDDVRRFNARLGGIGNINSDGRPIVGLDARDLLEIVLDTNESGFLVPAHIWTPWFSMLGSRSGFDSLAECFGDLSEYVFAAETGLSSDPAMNWRVSDLDRITLISNSDAHSPSRLGREANVFRTAMDYHAIRNALETGDREQFLGTYEFYPEEGKYHVDGHRKCEICFTPEQTRAHQGICPVCGKSLTLGVLHRVEILATRPEGIQPARAFPYHRLIPLDILLADILRVGEKSKKVSETYHSLINKLGNEFQILHEMDLETIAATGIPLLGEAISRMRQNRISFSPGYDGVFGSVQIFSDHERERLLGQRCLFNIFEKQIENSSAGCHSPETRAVDVQPDSIDNEAALAAETVVRLNPDQLEAIQHTGSALMIVAGPGTGKTRTLTHKIARLIEDGVDVDRILAVTFTSKAAKEMQTRLSKLVGISRPLPFVGTFHALGFQIMNSLMTDSDLSVIDEAHRRSLVRDAISLNRSAKQNALTLDDTMEWIAAAKQKMLACEDCLEGICPPDRLPDFKDVYKGYERLLEINRFVDFEDLIFRSIRLLKKKPRIQNYFQDRFSHIFIDEYQDINAGQYQLIRLLSGRRAALCVIGDPDQSIYGFRGSDINCFKWFLADYPQAKVVFLRRNYRSTQTILDVSSQVINKNPDPLDTGHRCAVYAVNSGKQLIHVMELPSEQAEAVAIGKTVEQMVGGTSFFSLDSDKVDATSDSRMLSFSDFAVLFRTRSQAAPIRQILEKAGIPCQVVDRRAVLDQEGMKAIISIIRLTEGRGLFDDLQLAGTVIKPSLPAATLNKLKTWAYRNSLSMSQALIQARRLPIPGLNLSRQQQLYEFTKQITDLTRYFEGRPMVERVAYVADHFSLWQTHTDDSMFENGYRQLMQTANDCGRDGLRFLADVALCKDTDTYDHRVEKVSLMTMHAAKGLEFPVVFISGCENEWIPYHSTTRPSDPEEERRLFYVAMTRAEHHLFLTRAITRRINGQRLERKLSPFVIDIESRYRQHSGPAGKKHQRPVQQQLTLF